MGFISYPADLSNIKGREYARSLYVAEDMKTGDVITDENVRSVRPGYGAHPRNLSGLIGKRVNRDLEKGTRFDMAFVKK